MSIFYFIRPVLKALENGKVIRSSVAAIVSMIAVSSLIGGLYLIVRTLETSFQMPAEGIIGGLVLSLIFAVAALIIFQVLWYHASEVRARVDSRFTVTPVISILLRMLGEIYAVLAVGIGMGGCVFLWIIGYNPMYLLPEFANFFPGFSGEGTFVGGLTFLLYLVIAAFVSLNRLTFDAGTLPSGVYFYRMTAGDYVRTMKLVFLK